MTLPREEDIVRAKIAIVLTDIIGSTKFVERNGNLNSAKWFKVHDRYCISLIYKFNGMLCDASDGFLMYFNTVQDALAFSLAYRKALVKHKFPFTTRIGIHYDDMLIIKTPQRLIDANHKRISLEGIGKSVAARTMSICGPYQVLLTNEAYLEYKRRIYAHPGIPKDALIVSVGLYKFKGVSNPEQIWVAGTQQSHLQPPPDGEKVKKIAGPKKIKTRLKHKKLKEKIEYFFWRLSAIYILFVLYHLWPLISSPEQKRMWNLDFWFLRPFEYLNHLIIIIYNFMRYFYEGT